jgi:RNA 2',3'-cyclic 3'-phosphodiesterase
LRAFIAIELTEAIHRRLAHVAGELRERTSAGTVRWVDPAGIHLTLKFLGEVSSSQAEDVWRLLEPVAAGQPAFEVRVRGLGCFPNLRSPRVVWVGVEQDEATLTGLQMGVESASEKLGFAREGRSFTPHLTLGRTSRDARREGIDSLQRAIQELGEAECGAMRVDQVHLFRSELKPSGAVYSVLATARLMGVMV